MDLPRWSPTVRTGVCNACTCIGVESRHLIWRLKCCNQGIVSNLMWQGIEVLPRSRTIASRPRHISMYCAHPPTTRTQAATKMVGMARVYCIIMVDPDLTGARNIDFERFTSCPNQAKMYRYGNNCGAACCTRTVAIGAQKKIQLLDQDFDSVYQVACAETSAYGAVEFRDTLRRRLLILTGSPYVQGGVVQNRGTKENIL